MYKRHDNQLVAFFEISSSPDLLIDPSAFFSFRPVSSWGKTVDRYAYRWIIVVWIIVVAVVHRPADFGSESPSLLSLSIYMLHIFLLATD